MAIYVLHRPSIENVPKPVQKVEDVVKTLEWTYRYSKDIVPKPEREELQILTTLIEDTWANLPLVVDVDLLGGYKKAWLKFRKMVKGCYIYAQGGHRIIDYNPRTGIYVIGSTTEVEKLERREHIVTIKVTDREEIIVLDSIPDEDLQNKIKNPDLMTVVTFKDLGRLQIPDMTKHMVHASIFVMREVFGG